MPKSFWTPTRDAELKRRWKTQSTTVIARDLGVTRNAVIGRIHRVLGTYAEKIEADAARLRAENRKKIQARKASEGVIIAVMRRDLSRGMQRDKAISNAAKAGATYRAIAREIGVSKQRAHQLAHAGP